VLSNFAPIVAFFPCCDRFCPRWSFLLRGSARMFLDGGVHFSAILALSARLPPAPSAGPGPKGRDNLGLFFSFFIFISLTTFPSLMPSARRARPRLRRVTLFFGRFFPLWFPSQFFPVGSVTSFFFQFIFEFIFPKPLSNSRSRREASL